MNTYFDALASERGYAALTAEEFWLVETLAEIITKLEIIT
jgi:hypothetical protein